MGRQFSYYCSPEDLADIEHQVFGPLGAQLLMAKKRDQRDHLVPAEGFPLARELMGTESLFLLLAPPDPVGAIAFNGSRLDLSNSHLIEVQRCHIKDGRIRPGRFWYEPRSFRDGEFHEKPEAFARWADTIFRQTKKLLSRRSFKAGKHDYVEWFGPRAWAEVESGELTVKIG